MKLLFIAAAGGIFFIILVVGEVRQSPPIGQGPAISAPPDSPPERFAIVQSRAEFQLVEASWAKPQDDDYAAGVRPAWEILVLAICVFWYLYYFHCISHTVTVVG